ncbi:MAG: helix-turn-helix transcriptional regulator [Chitinophagaceae bacterium]|jgi:AraC-like DNA-binding protein|nr:helix-turn-helix transcriptional regulator [Chitinophagaceae bacterium]
MYLRFRQKNFKTWLQEIATLFGVEAKNCVLVLPQKTAEGFCFADSIDRSFSYVLMNAHLKENCTIHRMSNNQPGLIIFFNQIQVGDYISVRSKKDCVTDHHIKERNNIFISSSNTELELLYTAGSSIRRLGIYLSPQWITEHFDTGSKFQLEVLLGKNLKIMNKLLINDEMQIKLNKIFHTNLKNDAEKLILKTRVIDLLEDFFSMFFNVPPEIRNKELISKEDINRLKHIEQILSNEDTEKFPSITMLARIAQMSSTKLKLRFKQVYGYRLYEFYNKQRLSKAKELIEKGITPKETAYSIGFANVSNFTKSFKKEYGYTPGRLLQKTSSPK